MKKVIFAAIVMILAVIVLFSVRFISNEVPTGTYVSDKDMAAVTILNQNIMRIYGPKETSASFEGEYVREGNKLVLSLTEQEDYVFLVKDKSLVFKSGAWLENWVNQGTIFYLSEE